MAQHTRQDEVVRKTACGEQRYRGELSCQNQYPPFEDETRERQPNHLHKGEALKSSLIKYDRGASSHWLKRDERNGIQHSSLSVDNQTTLVLKAWHSYSTVRAAAVWETKKTFLLFWTPWELKRCMHFIIPPIRNKHINSKTVKKKINNVFALSWDKYVTNATVIVSNYDWLVTQWKQLRCIKAQAAVICSALSMTATFDPQGNSRTY